MRRMTQISLAEATSKKRRYDSGQRLWTGTPINLLYALAEAVFVPPLRGDVALVRVGQGLSLAYELV